MHKDWAAILGRVLSEESAFKSLYDHHPDLIIVLDRLGNYVDSNRALGPGALCVPVQIQKGGEPQQPLVKYTLPQPWKD